MRYGFTTGSCAAAAAKAAAYMLLTGKIKNCITIETPKGIPYTAEVTDIVRGESQVSCAVVKDGGDDPDVTSGSKICATVTADNRGDGEKELLQIDGGKGVGRVTRPGLDQPVGNAAINHVPREMITREVQEVCRICDFHGTLHILISVPDGEALAFIDAEGKKEDVMEDTMEKIDFYLKKRAAGRLQIECIVYSNTYGLLGMTAKAEELLRRLL